MTYKIGIDGCDDSTIFEMELTEDEARLLEKVAAKAKKTSTYSCMPTMEVEQIFSANAGVSSSGGEPEYAPRECSEDSSPEFEPCDICGGTEPNFDGYCVQCEIPLNVIDPNAEGQHHE
jgi:hypothetical protein